MQKLKGYIYIILSAVIFGLMPLMAKNIYNEGVTPSSLVLFRNMFSMPFLIVLAFLTKGTIKIPLKTVPSVSIIAIMGCCLTPFLLFSSYNYIPSGAATVFHFIYPAAVVIIGIIFLKQKIDITNLISVVLCIVGVSFFNTSNEANDFFKGSILALASGVTYAIYIVLLAKFKNNEVTGFLFSFYIALISAISMFIICLITDSLKFPTSLNGWLLTVFFAIVLNVGAVVLFQQGTFLIGGERASILSTLEPITSVVAGIIVFDEFSYMYIIGTVIVLSASAILAIKDLKASKKEAQQ